MDARQRLLRRLDEIGRGLERSGHALVLIGLGSVGLEQERLDEYSDLDFFAIVEPQCKAQFIDDLAWLAAVAPLAWAHRNTADGYKVLFADGIFAEFAVFEPAELRHIPFAPGRIVWKRQGVSDDLAMPAVPMPAPQESSAEWLVGEALSNLYVGLCRWHRGEKLSAQRFIQHYAVDHVLRLAERTLPEGQAARDAFAPERRFEQRSPALAAQLPRFIEGYDRSPESALAILGFLERHWAVNAALAQAIRALA